MFAVKDSSLNDRIARPSFSVATTFMKRANSIQINNAHSWILNRIKDLFLKGTKQSLKQVLLLTSNSYRQLMEMKEKNYLSDIVHNTIDQVLGFTHLFATLMHTNQSVLLVDEDITKIMESLVQI